jgi:hypothetical protein
MGKTGKTSKGKLPKVQKAKDACVPDFHLNELKLIRGLA